jgi:hypothetical protein
MYQNGTACFLDMARKLESEEGGGGSYAQPVDIYDSGRARWWRLSTPLLCEMLLLCLTNEHTGSQRGLSKSQIKLVMPSAFRLFYIV